MTKTRAAYYLLLIALLMPALPESETTNYAAAAVKSVALEQSSGHGFCTDHNGLCGATNYLLQKFEAKAKYPIHVLSNWANQPGVKQPEFRA